MELRDFLPSVDSLLNAPEIGDLQNNRNFQYLLKAGYEQVQRIIS